MSVKHNKTLLCLLLY